MIIGPDERKPFYCNVVQAIIAALGSLTIVIIGYKIYKVVKRASGAKIKLNDKYMLVMVLFMALELFSKCIFHVFNAITVLNSFYWNHPILSYILLLLPVFLLMIACTINARNWVHFYIRISEAAYMSRLSPQDKEYELKSKLYHKHVKKMHLILKVSVISIFLIVSLSIVGSTVYSYYHPDVVNDSGRALTAVGFCCLSFTFFIFGYLTLLKLRSSFQDFYAANKNKLVFATLGLSIPMLTRALYDLFMIINKSFNTFVADHTDSFNFVILLVCDILPISL